MNNSICPEIEFKRFLTELKKPSTLKNLSREAALDATLWSEEAAQASSNRPRGSVFSGLETANNEQELAKFLANFKSPKTQEQLRKEENRDW